MIHLDTNYLIGLLVKASSQAVEVDVWLAGGELLAASAIAWTEFLNGPVTSAEISRANAILARAEVATVNQPDFKVFVPHGLKLAVAPCPPPPASAPQTPSGSN